MRYTVTYNPKPGKLICKTDSINEACWQIFHAPELEVRYVHFRRVPAIAGMLAHEAGEREEVEPGFWERTWEHRCGCLPDTTRPARVFVLRDRGEILWMSDQEVIERARRWDRHVSELRSRALREEAKHMGHRQSQRPKATKIRRNRCRSVILAEHSFDEDVPRLRPGARVVDWWWEGPDCVRISKCWKDQSRRRHQWRPVEL